MTARISTSTDVAMKTSYSKLFSSAEWKSFNEVCKQNTELQYWDRNLKIYAEEIMKTVKGGGCLSIDIWKPFTNYALHSNTTTVNAILEFKEEISKGKLGSKKKRKNEERVKDIADEYMKNSSHMLDFLSEMENFLTMARNSHSYVTKVTQQYFEMSKDLRGADANDHYKRISEKLKKLKDSNNIFEHSAESLLQKAVILKSHHEEMLQKLKVEIERLSKKEKRAKSWKRMAYTIFIGTLIGLAVAGIVTSVIAAPPVAAAIAACIVPIAMAEHWTISWFEESEKASKNQRKVNEVKRNETRVAIKELGNIKSSIDGVINQINSLLYVPNSAIDQDEIDLTMKDIKDKLGKFLEKIEDLDKDVKNCNEKIRKARDDVDRSVDVHETLLSKLGL